MREQSPVALQVLALRIWWRTHELHTHHRARVIEESFDFRLDNEAYGLTSGARGDAAVALEVGGVSAVVGAD